MLRNTLLQHANTHKNTQTTVALQHSDKLVNRVKTGMQNFSSLIPKVQSATPTKHAF